MRARLWSLPVVVLALVAGTAGGLGTAAAAPRSAVGGTGKGGPGWVPGAIRFAAATAPSREHGTARGPAGLRSGPAALVRRAAMTAAPQVAEGLAAGAVGAQKRGLPAPAMSQAMLRASQLMQAAAARYVAASHPVTARDLAATQQAQSRNYWCGPATLSEMLAQMKVRLSQQASARALGTTLSGTDWSNRHGYPMPRALNAHQRRHSYVAVALPWSPTRKQIAAFRTDLVSDISRGAPLAGAAYEVAGGPHLVGHPVGQTILHWFDMRGYSRSGAMTDYEDSVHGAANIAWSAGVPAYSTLPTTTIAVILGARGYVW